MNDDCNQECEAIGNTEIKNEQPLSHDTTSKKICGIYGLRNKLKPEKWNVGQSWDITERWANYKRLECKRQRKIYNSLLKYGYDGFEKIILEELVNPTQKLLDEREDYWMKFYNSIESGYNIRGAGSRGRHSEETKKKISISGIGKHDGEKNSSFGKPKSEETKRKISLSRKGKLVGIENPFFGKKHTEETKQKIRDARSKQVITEETKLKLRNIFSKQGYPHSGKKHSIETRKKLSLATTKYFEKKRTEESL